jgi:excisionase family DNA binding protein
MVAVAEYMTVSEAARALGVTDRAIHKRITSGHMRAERYGERAVLIPVEEVERWRELGRMKPGPKRRTEG